MNLQLKNTCLCPFEIETISSQNSQNIVKIFPTLAYLLTCFRIALFRLICLCHADNSTKYIQHRIRPSDMFAMFPLTVLQREKEQKSDETKSNRKSWLILRVINSKIELKHYRLSGHPIDRVNCRFNAILYRNDILYRDFIKH